MKTIQLFIVYYLINCLFGKDYDLLNGQIKSFNLTATDIYNFYISINQYQAAKIYLYFNEMSPSDSLPILNMVINEYSSRNGTSINSSQINISKVNNNEVLAAESSYFFDENKKNYLSFSISSNSYIGETDILIDIFGGYYEIEQGESKEFEKFYPGYPYYLTFKVKYGYLLNIKLHYTRLEMNANYMNIIEYSDGNHTNILNIVNNFEYESKDYWGYTDITISYLINNSNINSIGIKLFPKGFSSTYLKAIIEVEKYYFFLEQNQTFNLENLDKNSIYYFSLESKKPDLINISLNMKYKNKTIPITQINIYETNIAFSEEYLKSSSIKINYHSQSIIYNTTNLHTNCLLVKFQPYIDFEELEIAYNYINEFITEFNLINGVDKNLIDIQATVPYYFFINASFLKTLFISFIIEEQSPKPLYELNIYENLNKDDFTYDKAESYIVLFYTNENQLKANISYTIYNITTSNITYYSMIHSYIKLMNVKIDIGGESYELKNGITKEYKHLSNNFRYFFKICIERNRNISFILKIKDISNSSSLEAIIINEMFNKNIESKKYEPFSSSVIDNEINIDIFHEIIFNSTDEIMLEIFPKYDLDYIKVCANVDYYENNDSSEYSNKTLVIVFSVLGSFIFIAAIIIILIIRKNKQKDSNIISSRKDEQVELFTK